MGKLIDLTNQKFNLLTVISKIEGSSPVKWKCKCDCGNFCEVSGNNLRNNHTKSCGCLKKLSGHQTGSANKKDLTGLRFVRLLVISEANLHEKRVSWNCVCDCGNECVVLSTNLLSGTTKSCGCLKKESIVKAHKIDMIGKKFGKLLVLSELTERDSDGSYKYLCECECGNQKIISGCSLRSGMTTSCGCINYSIGEQNIINILQQNNINFIKEYSIKELNYLRFDFALFENNKINRLIEFDGRQHYEKINSVWEKTCSLTERQKRDNIKNEYAKSHNIPLVRIPYWERDNITLEMLMGDEYLI